MRQATPSPAPHRASPPERSALGRMFNWAALFHLAGLAELKRFPSAAQKDHAMRQIAMGRIGGVGGFVTRPIVLVLLSLLAPVVLLKWNPWGSFLRNPRVASLIYSFICVVIVLGLFYWVHRPLCARYLRRYLAEIGVPICSICGYDLAKVPESSKVCPECGAAFVIGLTQK